MTFKEFLVKVKREEIKLSSAVTSAIGVENLRRWKSHQHKPSPGLALRLVAYFPDVKFEFDDIQFFRVKHDVDLTRYLVKEDREKYKNLRKEKGLY